MRTNRRPLPGHNRQGSRHAHLGEATPLPRTLAAIDADLAAKTHQAHALADLHPQAAEKWAEINALLEERHRLRQGPLRPSQVLAKA